LNQSHASAKVWSYFEIQIYLSTMLPLTTVNDKEPDEESLLLGGARRKPSHRNSDRSSSSTSSSRNSVSPNSSNSNNYECDPSVPINRIRRMTDFLAGLFVASAAFLVFRQPGERKQIINASLLEPARFPGYPYAQLHDHTHLFPQDGLETKYKKFQALGFQIYTGGAPAVIRDENGKNHHNPECNGLNSYGKADDFDEDDAGLNLTDINLWECYLGYTNPKEDVQQRLQIMADAVTKAEEVSDKDPEVLKIFVAPEFFWRGKDGAYVFFDESNPTASKAQHDQYFTREELDDDCAEICHILRGLEEMVASPKYKDWLFLFGTVIVSEVLPKEDTFDYLFYNFAPVFRGFDPEETDHYGKRFLVPKRYVSNIDFLTPVRNFQENKTRELMDYTNPNHKRKRKYYEETITTVEEGPQHEKSTVVHNPFELNRKYYDRDMWYRYKGELEALGYTMLEYDWLILDNITFTVEVCLDHDAHTALNAYLADKTLGSPTKIPRNSEVYDPVLKRNTGRIEYVSIPRHQAQLSLVSSSGMTVNPASMALANNGTIILQDGLSSKEGSMTFESECEHYSWHFGGGSEHITRSAKLTATEISFQYNIHSGHAQHGIWDTLEDLEDVTWKSVIRGLFTTERYEPKITVYSPKEIAKV
jgi:hypothetical protein